jgi:hypothetical protein
MSYYVVCNCALPSVTVELEQNPYTKWKLFVRIFLWSQEILSEIAVPMMHTKGKPSNANMKVGIM